MLLKFLAEPDHSDISIRAPQASDQHTIRRRDLREPYISDARFYRLIFAFVNPGKGVQWDRLCGEARVTKEKPRSREIESLFAKGTDHDC